MSSAIQSPASPLRRRPAYARYLSAACLAILCTTASGSTLLLRPRIELNPIQDMPPNIAYKAIHGVIHDLNGDGAPDIVLGINGSHPAVYFNNGTDDPFENVPGVFVAPPLVNVSTFGAVTVSDVDADGHPDLAIAGFNESNRIYLNDGTATPFDNVTPIVIGTLDVTWRPAFGDVNGDGFVDMAVANTNHVPSRVYLTQGAPLTSGAYSVAQVGTVAGYGQNAVIADVNGDDRPDLILTYTIDPSSSTDPDGIAIYLNNGSADPFGSVTPLQLLAGQSVRAIAVADVNQDGGPDLITAVSNMSLGSATESVFLNTASPTEPFSTAQVLQPNGNLGGGCLDIAVEDMNGDSRPDLLFSCAAPAWNADPMPETPAVGSIYLNSGAANPFANVSPIDIPATTSSGYGRSVAVGTLVANAAPAVLVVDDAWDYGAYYPTVLAPVAANDVRALGADQAVTLDVLANDTSSDGTLDAASLTVTVQPVHGTAVVTNGQIVYTPAAGYAGVDAFQYSVRDNLGTVSNVATVSLSIQAAPVATNDTSSVQANRSVTINVIANDRSEGGTLDNASISIVSGPAHGTAAVANGSVTYTPNAGYSGSDSFQYSVRDNLGTVSNAATVSVQVTASPAGGGGGGGSFGTLELLALLGFLVTAARSRCNRIFARG